MLKITRIDIFTEKKLPVETVRFFPLSSQAKHYTFLETAAIYCRIAVWSSSRIQYVPLMMSRICRPTLIVWRFVRLTTASWFTYRLRHRDFYHWDDNGMWEDPTACRILLRVKFNHISKVLLLKVDGVRNSPTIHQFCLTIIRSMSNTQQGIM